jgi:hypothetical protein
MSFFSNFFMSSLIFKNTKNKKEENISITFLSIRSSGVYIIFKKKKSTFLKIIKAHDKTKMKKIKSDQYKQMSIYNIIKSVGEICKLYFKKNLPKEYVLNIIEVNF